MIYTEMEHYYILRSLARNATTYLEVGVRDGGSLQAVVAAAPRLHLLLLCDTWDAESGGTNRGSHAHIDELLDGLGYVGSRVYLDGRSQVTLPAFRDANPTMQFDLANVDGSHRYADVLADLENVWAMTRIMVAHDTSFSDVWRAMGEFGKRTRARSAAAFGDQGTIVFHREPGGAV